MKKVISILAMLLAVTMLSGCPGKKKTDGDVGGDPGADISSKDISFDPEGSDSGKIAGLNTINFEYDKAALTSDSKSMLKENAEWIKAHSNVVVQVEGHCDTRGSVEYNLALGERRARAVKSYLVGLGVDAKSMTIISYGEEKPVSMGSSESAHGQNRRANFVPLPK